MRSDLIARCRTGDRGAFAGLVGLWSDRALQVALQGSRDPEAAASAVAAAFVTAYAELPSLHRAHGFRAWLMSHVLRACESPPRDERLRVVMNARGPRRLRRADRALAALLGDTPRLRLPDSFYEERVAPALVEPSVATEVRPLADPRSATAVLATPGWWCAASGMAFTRATRTGAKGRGALPKPRRSHDVLEVTYQTSDAVGWITRSAISLVPGEVEACYDTRLQDGRILVRLRGVATPTGWLGYVTERVASDALPHRVFALEDAASRAFGGAT